jgi:hypothetical protein
MLSNKVGKLGKVTTVVEDLTAFLRLDELAVEVRRRCAIKGGSGVKRRVSEEYGKKAGKKTTYLLVSGEIRSAPRADARPSSSCTT